MRRSLRAVVSTLVAGALLAVGASGCGQDERGGVDDEAASPVATDPGPVHVHGLGINPSDGALFIATHTGLWRAAPDEAKARRVGDRFQDTMGFTVVGADHFLGSGHPDVRDDLPPLLGLIESTDAGRTWEPVSLLGEADFHVLRSAGDVVYGFDSSNERLLLSTDRGDTWTPKPMPEPLVDLAVHPQNSKGLLASGAERLYASENGGETWRVVAQGSALLAWPSASTIYALTGDGTVLSTDAVGRKWRVVGEVPGEPAAFLAESDDQLFVALHDGTIMQSADGGATWTVRVRP